MQGGILILRRFLVAVHTCVPGNGILPMLRIPNRQNLLPELYLTEFSVQKIPTRIQQPGFHSLPLRWCRNLPEPHLLQILSQILLHIRKQISLAGLYQMPPVFLDLAADTLHVLFQITG